MLKRLLETVRKYSLLKLLLFFHVMVIAILVAFYYQQAETALWGSRLYVPVVRDADGNWRYQMVARGPSLLLPWNLPPQHVLWLGLDILIVGSLTMWLAYWIVGDELRHQVAGREEAAADKLLEAEEQSVAADSRMRAAEAWEQRLKARESRVEPRESAVVNRELETQARTEEKDAEVKKMSVALTRLKTEVRKLRGGP